MNYSAIARRAGIILLALLFGGAGLRAQEATQAQWNQLLFTAAKAGQSGALAEILDPHHAAVDAEDADGWTALFHAATAEGDPGDSVALLLQRGADADHINKKGKSALMLAALKGNSGCVRALLAGGANRALANPAGLTAAELAKKQGQGEIAALLQMPSAPGSLPGSLPVSTPASTSSSAPSSALRTAGTAGALLQACADEKLAEVSALLGGGADPDQAGAKGMTCLMIAAFKGNSRLAKLLLRAGANPALRLDGQATAAELAQKQHHADTAALIRNW